MRMNVILQVWDSINDIPQDVEVEVEFDPGQPDTYDVQGYGPEVEVLSTTPLNVNLDAYEQELIRLCEDELRERRTYFIEQREACRD